MIGSFEFSVHYQWLVPAVVTRIGVSNYNAEQVAEVVSEFKEAPAVNQARHSSYSVFVLFFRMFLPPQCALSLHWRFSGILPTTTRRFAWPCANLAQP